MRPWGKREAKRSVVFCRKDSRFYRLSLLTAATFRFRLRVPKIKRLEGRRYLTNATTEPVSRAFISFFNEKSAVNHFEIMSISTFCDGNYIRSSWYKNYMNESSRKAYNEFNRWIYFIFMNFFYCSYMYINYWKNIIIKNSFTINYFTIFFI